MRIWAYERENESVRGIHERAGKRGRKKVREKLRFFDGDVVQGGGISVVCGSRCACRGTVSPSVGDVGAFRRREWHRLALVWSLPQSVSPTAPSPEGADGIGRSWKASL